MIGASAEQIVLEVGKSSELVSAFQMVEEAEIDGEPKFSPQVCRDLAKAIACRNYAKAVLELCHLVRLADAVSGGAGYEMFFWGGGAARPSAFRGQVQEGLGMSDGVRVVENGAEVIYPDGSFTVTFGRMPFLSAFLEFLITTVGYADMDGVVRKLLGSDVTQKEVSQRANELSRILYEYLKDHLPTAQNQRKFRRVIDFMEGRFGEEFGADAVDDTVVFEFWLAESVTGTSDGVDFKTFVTAFKTLVRFRQSLECAADYKALENPQVIGFDREAGEIDPDAVYGAVDTIDGYRSPLLELDEPPAASIKFLNRRETGALTLLFECGDAAYALPLSIMRSEVFGKGQAQITQALRRKVTPAEMADLVNDCAPESYTDRKDDLSAIAAHVDRALLASLHALARNRSPETISLVMALRPKTDFTVLREAFVEGDEEPDDNVVYLRASTVSERFLAVIEDSTKVGDEVAGLMAEARKAFRGLSRQGFAEDTLDDPDIAEGFVTGAKTLIDIGAQVSSFIDLLGRTTLPRGDWDQQFVADKSEFSKQFGILYGGIQ